MREEKASTRYARDLGYTRARSEGQRSPRSSLLDDNMSETASTCISTGSRRARRRSVAATPRRRKFRSSSF